jgi:hypothetical protein
VFGVRVWCACAAAPPMATLRRLLRRGCRRQLVPCYLVVWWWLLYCITILEWRKLLNVEIFGVEVRDAEASIVSSSPAVCLRAWVWPVAVALSPGFARYCCCGCCWAAGCWLLPAACYLLLPACRWLAGWLAAWLAAAAWLLLPACCCLPAAACLPSFLASFLPSSRPSARPSFPSRLHA